MAGELATANSFLTLAAAAGRGKPLPVPPMLATFHDACDQIMVALPSDSLAKVQLGMATCKGTALAEAKEMMRESQALSAKTNSTGPTQDALCVSC